MKVEQKPLKDLKPYWRNPRKNERTIELLKQSIEKFGFNVPLVVDKKGVLITGHARYKALLELGWKEAPVVVSGMSAKQAKEYRISDNKIQEETDWDEDLLKSEMREFEEVIGFSTEELQKILDKEENEVVKAYEQDDFQKTADNFATHHANVVEGAEDSIVQVVCPHCAGEFGVNKDNFKNSNPNKGW